MLISAMPRRRLLALATTVGLLAAGAVATATTPHATASTTALSGAYSGGGDVTGAQAFGTWRGKAVNVVTDFVPSDTWSTLSSPTWAADQWQGKGYQVAWGVAMLPKSGGSMATGAAGGYNGYFRTLSQTLVSRGLGGSVIRLGWEMNGTWYPWSAVPSPSTYVSYWRQVVNSMRSISGAAFRFEWAPNAGEGTSGFNVASAYPGDSYVDLIGTSFYDQSWKYPSTDVVDRWAYSLTEPYGLNWRVSFAATHGKRNSFPEWGLAQRCDGAGGNDNPYYIQKIRDWISSHDYYYESYFDYDPRTCELHAETGTTFPKAATDYKQLFGTTTTTTTTSTSSTLDTSVIKVSWQSDRSGYKTLNWLGLTGKVYVFVNPGVTTSQIRFYLDDTTMSRTALHVESSWPWDLMGGTTAAANAFDAGALATGTHTLTVAVVTSTGTKVARASFLR